MSTEKHHDLNNEYKPESDHCYVAFKGKYKRIKHYEYDIKSFLYTIFIRGICKKNEKYIRCAFFVLHKCYTRSSPSVYKNLYKVHVTAMTLASTQITNKLCKENILETDDHQKQIKSGQSTKNFLMF